MRIEETVLEIFDREGKETLSYVSRVNESWFAISMLEQILYCFEVQEQEFVDYAINNGILILFDELPEDIYKCFTATFFTIAEVMEELDENY